MVCSKKSWAYVFIGFGGTFLVIGIVCGFVIPKIVIGIVEDKSCVDSQEDSDFEDWVKEKPDQIITRLYYWEITNKDGFLYNKEFPVLRERGPYVYKQTTKNVNVSFKDHKRSYKSWKKNAKFYKDESCANCSEDDQITILNIGYLGVMEKFGGDEMFAAINLPHTISLLIKQFNNSYEQLGKINQTVWHDPLKSGWKHPGFGTFANTNFSITEMEGLYGVLSNTTLLFGERLTNTTLNEQCNWDKDPVQTKCGWLAKMQALAQLKARNLANTTKGIDVFQSINHTLCPDPTGQCFNRPKLIENVGEYIQHVNRYTMSVVIGEKYEVVTTMSQKNIALGYFMETIPDPQTGEKVDVPGIIKIHKSEQEANEKEKYTTFYTCEAGDDLKHQWAEYDGKTSISVVPNLTTEDSMVRGYLTIAPRSDTAAKPCAFSHKLPYDHLEVFTSALGMRMMVRYKGETSLHGLDLKRFTPTKNDFLQHSGVQQGYIDFTAMNKVTTFLSFAHLLYTNVTVPESFHQKPDRNKHESTVDVEPVTGIMASAFMRIQLNMPIKEEFVKVPRIKGKLNMTYLADNNEKLYLKSIPIVWGEYGGEATEDDIDSIKKQVVGALGLACGILIALPVLGGIFIIVAIILLVVATKANQISELSK